VIALIVASGFSVMGLFIGDGLRNIKSTDRYVNVRGLSEREVTADTAKLLIHVEHAGSTPAAIFPLIAETQKLVLAFLTQEGIKEAEIETGQWSTTRTGAQALKDDPSLPRYSVSSIVSVTTHNVEAIQNAYRKINDLRMKTKGGVMESDVSYSFTGVGRLRAEMIAAATKMHATRRCNLPWTPAAKWGRSATLHRASFRSRLPVKTTTMSYRFARTCG